MRDDEGRQTTEDRATQPQWKLEAESRKNLDLIFFPVFLNPSQSGYIGY